MSTEMSETGTGLAVRPGRRRRPGTPSDEDRSVARRTVPVVLDPAHPVVDPAAELEVWALHVCFQRTRDPDVLGVLVQEYTSYCYSLARRLHRGGEPLEDLRQVAMVGLISALGGFDHERRLPFVGFATPTIVGALKRHHRDHGWALRIPREAHAVATALPHAVDRLTRRDGVSDPADEDVARELGLEVEVFRASLAALRARATRSLDAPFRSGVPNSVPVPFDDPGYRASEDRTDLHAALGEISSEDRRLLAEYFFVGRSQAELARRMGISQMQVSRRLRRALGHLRKRMD